VKYVKAFGQFWYEFVIGDDPKIAVAVVIALAVLVAALSIGLFGEVGLTVLGGVLIVAAFAVTLVIDTRPRVNRDR
jgi:hypothetical protein